jgi:acyl-CoA thioesterase
MPGCVAERLGHQGPPWFAPSADLTVYLLEPLRTEWLLAHDRARWADDGWASAESVLWDENGTLVAYATQMMLFTYLPDQPKLRDSQDAKDRCDDRLPHPLGPPA